MPKIAKKYSNDKIITAVCFFHDNCRIAKNNTPELHFQIKEFYVFGAWTETGHIIGEKINKKVLNKLMFAYLCTPFNGKTTDSVAQLVEQYTFNVWVLGSSPSRITTKATS